MLRPAKRENALKLPLNKVYANVEPQCDYATVLLLLCLADYLMI